MTPISRLRVTFWALVAAAVAAVGLLSRALSWPAGPVAGVAVAGAGVVAVAAGGSALRILVVTTRGQR